MIDAVHLIEPALGRVSGGIRYNHAASRAAPPGQLTVRTLPGNWPEPCLEDEARLQEMLDSLQGPVILDGMLGCTLTRPATYDGVLLQLVHLPRGHAGGETADRERACLTAADGIVVTSQAAAEEIAALYGLPSSVARPGTQPRPTAVPETAGGRLLCLASIEERKNQLLLAEALSSLSPEVGVHTTFAGPIAQPAYAQRLHAALAALPPTSWEITGELAAGEVDAALAATDLLVLPSVHETYGMVISEAAAAGIPAFVVAGTGAEEALQAGCALPSDPKAWAEAITSWLTDKNLRTRLRQEALAVRTKLPGWEATAEALFDAVAQVATGAPASPERGDWLDMRVAHDDRARKSSLSLVDVAIGAVRETGGRAITDRVQPLRVCDIGAGTGRSAVWFDSVLAARGLTDCDWLLVDDDSAALRHAVTRLARAKTQRAAIVELPRLLAAGPPVDLLTGSAVLDVLREADADALVEAMAVAAVPALFLLTVTGDWQLQPAHVADAHVAEAFAAHQQREGRLGADAAGHLQAAAESAGMHVQATKSPWELSAAADAAFLTRFLADRVTAASEQAPESAAVFTEWLHDRMAEPKLTVTVGHRDLLILPAGLGEPR